MQHTTLNVSIKKDVLKMLKIIAIDKDMTLKELINEALEKFCSRKNIGVIAAKEENIGS